MPLISVLTPTIRGKEGLKRPKESLENQSFKGFEWLIEKHDPKQPSDFNQAMNRMLKKAKGELIVILQDYIQINKNGLKRFAEAYKKEPNTYFTAPVGRTLDEKNIEWDWRLHKSNDEELGFNEWEIDWASGPKKGLFEIGGFDEELDKYWGFDNVSVGLRLDMAGYKIKNLKENKAIAIDHNKLFQHPYQKIRNPDFANYRLQQIRMGLKINYL